MAPKGSTLMPTTVPAAKFKSPEVLEKEMTGYLMGSQEYSDVKSEFLTSKDFPRLDGGYYNNKVMRRKVNMDNVTPFISSFGADF
jgi:hypothetical protein